MNNLCSASWDPQSETISINWQQKYSNNNLKSSDQPQVKQTQQQIEDQQTESWTWTLWYNMFLMIDKHD